jgi:hypothetical protein
MQVGGGMLCQVNVCCQCKLKAISNRELCSPEFCCSMSFFVILILLHIVLFQCIHTRTFLYGL